MSSTFFSNTNTISNTNTNTNKTEVEDGKCEMFGSFGYIVQFILGVLSFMVLIEKPKRPWKIWFFDVSKQLISACLAHLMNLFLAIFLSLDNNTDQCVWYFVNIFVDTTLGVLICYILMYIIERIAKAKNWKIIQSGLYYETYEKNGKKKTKLKYKMYFMQLLIWVLVVIISKGILLGLQKLCTNFLEIFGNSILSPFNNNGKLKLIIVMILIPLILNAINFWIIDNILKLKTEEKGDEHIEEIKDIYRKEVGEIKELEEPNLNIYVYDENHNYVNENNNKIYGITGGIVLGLTPDLNNKSLNSKSSKQMNESKNTIESQTKSKNKNIVESNNQNKSNFTRNKSSISNCIENINTTNNFNSNPDQNNKNCNYTHPSKNEEINNKL